MAIRATREILIEAPRSAVMDALADVTAWPSYSSMHKHVDVVDRYPDGRPHHVRVKVRVLGLSDTERRPGCASTSPSNRRCRYPSS